MPLEATHRIEALWDTRNDAVTAHVCLPDGAVRQPAAAERTGLVAAAAHIGMFLDAGERFLVCVPLSLATLASASSREVLMTACGEVPAHIRPYLVFILGDIPAGISRADLTEAASMLRPFGRAIAALAPDCRDLAPYINHAVSGLALDFGGGFADCERTRTLIGCAGEAAQDLRWGVMALRLDDRRLLTAVQAADFRFLHGAATPRANLHPIAFPSPSLRTSPDARTLRF
jgi:hypothetical protein